MGQLLGVGLIVVVFAVAYGIRLMSQRHRAAAVLEMQSWASEQGYAFAETDDARFGTWTFRPFGVGTHRHAKRVVSGRVSGHAFVAFDYTYETTGGPSTGAAAGNNNATWHFAVSILQLPSALPEVSVNAVGFLEKAHLQGDEGIDLGDPEFGRAYRVQCADPQLAKDVLPAATRSRVRADGLTGLHIVDDQLIAWQKEASNHPPKLAARLALLAGLIAAVPPSVWDRP